MSENLETENSFEDLVDAALAKDYNKANEIFGAAIAAKQTDLLDQERIKVAGQIFNGDDDEDVDTEADDLEDAEDVADADDDQEDADVDGDEEDTEDDNSSEVEK